MKRLVMALVMAGLVGTGAVAEAGDKLDDFITRFYTLVLGRTPEPAGLANWRAYLEAHPTSAGAAAFSHGFLESPEFLGQNYPVGTYVTILYRAFMGREPDPVGQANWMSHLEAGRHTRYDVAELFIESAEFEAIWQAIFPGTRWPRRGRDDDDRRGRDDDDRRGRDDDDCRDRDDDDRRGRDDDDCRDRDDDDRRDRDDD